VNCIVTAGPTFEPLDEVRRLTNFSTGRFGSLLANFLAQRGHIVTLLLGQNSTYKGEHLVQDIIKFSTTEDLREKLEALAGTKPGAIYHAAAVSDFRFGKIYAQLPGGKLEPLKAGKVSTRSGSLLAELIPTTKVINQLRAWFPHASIVGWKYEVDGGRADVVRKAGQQLVDNHTDACVANGPAYGFGFGLVTRDATVHCSDLKEIFGALEQVATSA
jgi:phosphopantothenoylcysteine synthetase/decarboxylase